MNKGLLRALVLIGALTPAVSYLTPNQVEPLLSAAALSWAEHGLRVLRGVGGHLTRGNPAQSAAATAAFHTTTARSSCNRLRGGTPLASRRQEAGATHLVASMTGQDYPEMCVFDLDGPDFVPPPSESHLSSRACPQVQRADRVSRHRVPICHAPRGPRGLTARATI